MLPFMVKLKTSFKRVSNISLKRISHGDICNMIAKIMSCIGAPQCQLDEGQP